MSIAREVGAPELDLAPGQLSPFEVPVDGQQILDIFPGVGQMLGFSMEHFFLIRTSSSKIEDDSFSRADRRQYSSAKTGSLVFNLSLPLIHLTRRLEPAELEAKTKQLFADGIRTSHYFVAPEVRQYIVDSYSEDIENEKKIVNAINDQSGATKETALRQIVDDPLAQYEFLKMLMMVESKTIQTDERESDWDVLRWLNMMVHIGPNGASSPVGNLLREQLENGQYDSFIARDLINWQIAKTEQGEPEENLLNLTALMGLIKHVSGAEIDSAAVSRLCDTVGLEMWPAENYIRLRHGRDSLARQLAYVDQRVRDYGHGLIEIPGHDYEKDFDESLVAFLDFLSKHNPNITKRFGGQVYKPAGTPKRRTQRNGKRGADETGNGSAAIQEVEDIPQLTLAYFDSNGNLHAEGSPEFKEMVDEFLQKHENTPYLEEDVAKILDHIRTFNFANGRIPGVKRTKAGDALLMTDDARMRLPIWEFKPTEAPGFSLKTSIGPRTRTLFCNINNQTIAIGGIIHRDRLDHLIRKIRPVK